MIKYGYLVVEGPHDIDFIGRFLKLLGCSRVKNLSALDKFWHPLVPRHFPYADDLLRRMPIPTFFKSATHSIALHSAIGDNNIINTIEETLAVTSWNVKNLVGIGIILDADSKVSANKRFEEIKSGLHNIDFITELPQSAGEVNLSKPNSGIFIMPDNLSAGTLEDLLLECAEQAYPSLLQCTQRFIDCVEPIVPTLNKYERRDFQKPAGHSKMMVACIANVLRPGKSVQVSIQDNRWVTTETIKLPRMMQINIFLQELFIFP